MKIGAYICKYAPIPFTEVKIPLLAESPKNRNRTKTNNAK